MSYLPSMSELSSYISGWRQAAATEAKPKQTEGDPWSWSRSNTLDCFFWRCLNVFPLPLRRYCCFLQSPVNRGKQKAVNKLTSLRVSSQKKKNGMDCRWQMLNDSDDSEWDRSPRCVVIEVMACRAKIESIFKIAVQVRFR